MKYTNVNTIRVCQPELGRLKLIKFPLCPVSGIVGEG